MKRLRFDLPAGLPPGRHVVAIADVMPYISAGGRSLRVTLAPVEGPVPPPAPRRPLTHRRRSR